MPMKHYIDKMLIKYHSFAFRFLFGMTINKLKNIESKINDIKKNTELHLMKICYKFQRVKCNTSIYIYEFHYVDISESYHFVTKE